MCTQDLNPYTPRPAQRVQSNMMQKTSNAEVMAQADYRIKVQVKQFWDVLAGVQALRRDVQDAQRITPK